jgi:hypothetical protein
MTKIFTLKLSMITVFLMAIQLSYSQTIVAESINLQTNGNINALQVDDANGIMYIGGNFTRVGNRTRYGGAVDNVNGDLSFSHPTPNGTIKIAKPDGSGGYFLAGDFTAIGETVRNGLAHVTSGGVVSSWDPNPNNDVLDIEVSGGIVYVGGAFTSIGGASRARIAAIDATTGLANSWNPGTNGNVNQLAVSGGFVYAYIPFSTLIGGEAIEDLAKISISTGLVEATWEPGPIGGSINDMLVDGSNLYIGGFFTSVQGVTRNRLAAIEIATGDPTSWDPNVSSGSAVYAIEVHGGNLYAGGAFTTVGAQTVENLAEIDLTTGTTSSFTLTSGNNITALKVSGNSLYVSNFSFTIGSEARNGIGEVDLTTHTLTSWNPGLKSYPSTIAISGSDIYLGGSSLLLMGGERRNNLAAIELEDGIVTSWNPDADGTIYDIELSSTSVYVAGSFDNVGGQVRDNLADIQKSDGLATAFDPDVASIVYDILLEGDQLYVGGTFTTVGGGSRNNLAVYDLTDGSLSAWDPNLNSIVLSLAADDGTLYVGGNFTTASGTSRDRIAAFDITTETLTSWNPGANDRVESLAVGNDGTVYAGGRFSTIGGLSRTRFASIDPTTGVVNALDIALSWVPYSIQPSQQGTIYVGGGFATVNGTSQSGAFAFNSNTDAVLDWDIQTQSNVNDIALSDASIYLGGTFSTVLGETTGDFAGVSRVNEAPVSFTLPDNSILENEAVDAVIGSFEVTDDAGDTHSYVLVAGDGDDDNTNFGIDGSSLTANVSLDFETKNSYSVRARVTDDKGNFVEDSFTINVSNVIETGTDITTISIPEQVSPADINTSTHTVNIDIGFGNDPSSLAPVFELSSGATADPVSGTTRDFSLAKTYTVTAENGFTDQGWLVFIRGYYPAQTFTVGPTGDFANLVAAFDDLRSVGISGDIFLELEDGFTDPGGTLTGGWTGQENNTVTIRPEDGATSVAISKSSVRCTVCFMDIENVVFDGLDVLEVENTNGFGSAFYFETTINSEVIEFRNMSITTNSGDAFYIQDVDDLLIENISYSFGANLNTRNATVFRVLNTSTDVKIFNNQIELDDQFDGAFGLTFVNSSINDTYVYNNVVHAFPTSANSFTAFRDYGKFVHNTLVVDGTGTIGSSIITRLSQTAIDAQIANNIIVADIDNNAGNISSFFTNGSLQPSWNFSNNNFYVRDADADDYPDIRIVGNYGSYDIDAILAIAPGTSFIQPVFTDQVNGDLTLSGASLSDSDLRGTPNADVLTDINGTTRSVFASSKGAYETPNNVTDISSFTFTGIDGEATIDKTNHTVDAIYLDGTDFTNISPTIGIISGAMISPTSSSSQDFTSSVTYTVTAEAGNTQDWTVSITDRNITWDGTTWSNGTGPTASDNVIINGTYTFFGNGSFECNELTINTGGFLVVNGEGTLEVNGDIVNDGTIRITSGSSLLTYATNSITGNDIEIRRNTRYADGKYSFVGSPVEQDASIVGSDLGTSVYKYNEATAYGADGINRWEVASADELVPAKGYTQANQQEIIFNGVPNMGTIIHTGTFTEDSDDANEGWNLVANPYAASINVEDFLDANTNTSGSVYIWDDNGSNTQRGTNADYIVANESMASSTTAGGQSRYNFHLGSSQAFFVKLNSAANTTITFTEGMRRGDQNGDANFFRETELPIARINLTNSEGLFKQAVIGFAEDATENELNRKYDANAFNVTSDNGLFTMKAGRSLTLNGMTSNWETIQLQLNTKESGLYTISLELEEYDQSLFLVDNVTDDVIDLRNENYTFSASAGIDTDRFQLLSSPQNILGLNENEVLVYAYNKVLHIQPSDDLVREYLLFDMNAKQLLNTSVRRKTEVNLGAYPSGIYLVFDGQKTHKIILD